MNTKRVALVVLVAMLGIAAPSVFAARPSGSPLALFAFADGARVTFDGVVVARAEAGPYVYLEIERVDGTHAWVVTLASSQGAKARAPKVHVVAIGHAAHFDSKRLHRSFDDLYFAVVRPA